MFIMVRGFEAKDADETAVVIRSQNGSVNEAGMNGLTQEVLLATPSILYGANPAVSKEVRKTGYRGDCSSHYGTPQTPRRPPWPEVVSGGPICQVINKGRCRKTNRQRGQQKMERMTFDLRRSRDTFKILWHSSFLHAGLAAAIDSAGVPFLVVRGCYHRGSTHT